jgi:hypothetical protein
MASRFKSVVAATGSCRIMDRFDCYDKSVCYGHYALGRHALSVARAGEFARHGPHVAPDRENPS